MDRSQQLIENDMSFVPEGDRIYPTRLMNMLKEKFYHRLTTDSIDHWYI
jgi:hypothetical protein